MARQESNSAHNRAVQAISDARQHVRKYLFDLERANIPEDQIFVQSDNPDHPQKLVHAALMDYWGQVNKVEYIMMFDDLWHETLTDAAGHDLEVEVPRYDHVTKTVTEGNIDNMVPDMDTIETKTTTTSLEMLAHKWAGRSITVEARVESPYRDVSAQTEQLRLWMPPKIIKAANAKIDDCLSKVGLLAKTSAPIEKDPDPI